MLTNIMQQCSAALHPIDDLYVHDLFMLYKLSLRASRGISVLSVGASCVAYFILNGKS